MFVPHEEEDEYSTTDESEDPQPDLGFRPSRLRADAVPTWDDDAVSADEEEEEEDYDDFGGFNSDDEVVPEPEEVRDLEAELMELEENEGGGLIESLREQQEADLKVARGTTALQNQYSALFFIRFKLQNLLISANALPPSGGAFDAASKDPEAKAMLDEIAESMKRIELEMSELKTQLQAIYGWSTPEQTENVADKMMDIIQHWGLRTRLGSTQGSVINRPIEVQIASALDDRPSLIQPTRHRDENERIFGLETQPPICDSYYNDYAWYKRLLADYVSEKKPDAKVVVEKVKAKHTLKGRQITYDPIPELQGFMIPSKPCIVPDNADVLFNSLMK